MAKKKIPAFPLPLIKATVSELNPNWKAPEGLKPHERGYFDGYRWQVIRQVEVLTLNFQSGSMRVRIAQGDYAGQVVDIPAAEFFKQCTVSPALDVKHAVVRGGVGANTYVEVDGTRWYDSDDIQ